MWRWLLREKKHQRLKLWTAGVKMCENVVRKKLSFCNINNATATPLPLPRPPSHIISWQIKKKECKSLFFFYSYGLSVTGAWSSGEDEEDEWRENGFCCCNCVDFTLVQPTGKNTHMIVGKPCKCQLCWQEIYANALSFSLLAHRETHGGRESPTGCGFVSPRVMEAFQVSLNFSLFVLPPPSLRGQDKPVPVSVKQTQTHSWIIH